jgi:hypothetical protein
MVWTHKFALLLVKHQRVTRLFQDLLLDLQIPVPISTICSAWLCEQFSLTDWCIVIINYRGAELFVSPCQGENNIEDTFFTYSSILISLFGVQKYLSGVPIAL